MHGVGRLADGAHSNGVQGDSVCLANLSSSGRGNVASVIFTVRQQDDHLALRLGKVAAALGGITEPLCSKRYRFADGGAVFAAIASHGNIVKHLHQVIMIKCQWAQAVRVARERNEPNEVTRATIKSTSAKNELPRHFFERRQSVRTLAILLKVHRQH